MILKYAFSLLLFFAVYGQLTAQTVISHEINIADTTQLHALYTTDGHQFLGLTKYIHDDTIGFQIRNITKVRSFKLSDIAFLGLFEESFSQTGGFYIDDNLLTDEDIGVSYPMPLNQLLYSATGIPYASNGTYRNTMVLANQVDFQISNNFGVSGGALIPALLMGRAQFQLSASDMLHLGLAVQHYIILFDEQSATHPYAIVTLGDRKQYLNFTMGYWIDRYGYSNRNDTYPMVTMGGSFAFAKNWRFFVDAAAVFQAGDNLVLPSFNFSNKRRKSMLEFGMLAIPEGSFPLLPLLSYHRIF